MYNEGIWSSAFLGHIESTAAYGFMRQDTWYARVGGITIILWFSYLFLQYSIQCRAQDTTLLPMAAVEAMRAQRSLEGCRGTKEYVGEKEKGTQHTTSTEIPSIPQAASAAWKGAAEQLFA